MKFHNYYEMRTWLEGFIPYTYSKKNLGLVRIRYLLKLLGNPQEKFKSILVAGTSGKGSTAFYIAKLLEISENSESQRIRKLRESENQKTQRVRESDAQIHRLSGLLKHRHTESSEFSGLKIGLHLSPHLSYIGERMRVQGIEIRVKRLVNLMNEIRPIVEEIKKESPDLTPSYFEILVAASFLYFAQEKVDWAVVEVGLGGRLDATNILQPEISVITNVGLDHTEILGNTVEKIALEKAGIIKGSKAAGQKARPLLRPNFAKAWPWTGNLVVTGATGKALKVIEEVAGDKKARLIKVNVQNSLEAIKSVVKDYHIIYRDIERYTDKSFAPYNFLLAFTTVLALGFRPVKRAVLRVMRLGLEGRLEEIDHGVVLDGAHNVEKIRFLINSLKNSSLIAHSSRAKSRDHSSLILVVAFKKGKDWKKMLDLLVKNLPVKKIIATKFYAMTDTGQFAAVEPDEIAKYAMTIVNSQSTIVKIIDNSQEAVFEAINLTSNKLSTNQLILATGSLYLVGEVRTSWQLPPF